MKNEKNDAPSQERDPFPTKSSTTEHQLEIGGREFSYRAVTDWITLRKIHEPVAKMFHTAYFADTSDSSTRPLTFVFNGGPGAASAFLHMGALGPKRVPFGTMGSLPEPPTRVVDNHESWLAFTDLVFIDPVGTGFSRSLQESKPNEKDAAKKPDKPGAESPKENPEYWAIEKDLDSLGEFIRRFLSTHHRWTSPVFIAGESYGGFRVAKMARRLQETHGVGLNGAILISPAIELESLSGSDYDSTYWVELFPSLAGAAFHHGRASGHASGSTLEDVLERAETFARNDLVRWLVQGDALPENERVEVIQKMSDFIGLPTAFIARCSGRITSTMYCRELLRADRRICGHYDASITTADPFPDRDQYEGPDPTLFSIDRLFTGAINHQLRTNLAVDTELDYRLLSMQVNEAWKDESHEHFFHKLVGAMDDLRYGMSLNEHMKVYITHGYFDLITPYFGSDRLVGLMKLTPEQRENLTRRHYKGGHMFYSWDESRAAFHGDMERFYKAALSGS